MRAIFGLVRGIIGCIVMAAATAAGVDPEVIMRVEELFFPRDATEDDAS